MLLLPLLLLLDHSPILAAPHIAQVDQTIGGREKRYVIRAKRWKKRKLTWQLLPTNLIEADIFIVRNTMHRAFNEWSSASSVEFEEIPNGKKSEKKPDIYIEFKKGDHSDGYPFDGQDGVVAHAFYPRDGRLHFDADEQWSLNSVEGVNLLQTAVHEIGHLLGLEHSMDERAAMYAAKRPYDPKFTLGDDDVRAIRSLFPLLETTTTVPLSSTTVIHEEEQADPFEMTTTTVSPDSFFPFPLPSMEHFQRRNDFFVLGIGNQLMPVDIHPNTWAAMDMPARNMHKDRVDQAVQAVEVVEYPPTDAIDNNFRIKADRVVFFKYIPVRIIEWIGLLEHGVTNIDIISDSDSDHSGPLIGLGIMEQVINCAELGIEPPTDINNEQLTTLKAYQLHIRESSITCQGIRQFIQKWIIENYPIGSSAVFGVKEDLHITLTGLVYEVVPDRHNEQRAKFVINDEKMLIVTYNTYTTRLNILHIQHSPYGMCIPGLYYLPPQEVGEQYEMIYL